MKKKKWIWVIGVVALLALLFVPIPSGTYKDGGTRTYTALTYKIVDWHRLSADGVYEETSVYFFPDNFKSIDALWEQEDPVVTDAQHRFSARVTDISGTSVTVTPMEDEDMCDLIRFSAAELEDIGAKVGDVVQITYTGLVMESYPAQIRAVSWKLEKIQELPYSAQYIRTDGYQEGAQYPRYYVIRTVEELESYYQQNKDTFDLGRRADVAADQTLGFLDACDAYDSAFFEDSYLLFILLEEGSGSIRHEITGVFRSGAGRFDICVDTITPEVGTCDMAQGHIILELDKAMGIPDPLSIRLY